MLINKLKINKDDGGVIELSPNETEQVIRHIKEAEGLSLIEKVIPENLKRGAIYRTFIADGTNCLKVKEKFDDLILNDHNYQDALCQACEELLQAFEDSYRIGNFDFTGMLIKKNINKMEGDVDDNVYSLQTANNSVVEVHLQEDIDPSTIAIGQTINIKGSMLCVSSQMYLLADNLEVIQ